MAQCVVERKARNSWSEAASDVDQLKQAPSLSMLHMLALQRFEYVPPTK